MTVFGFQDQDIKGIMISFLFLSLSDHLLSGNQLSCYGDTKEALYRGSHGKELRPPANSHGSEVS